MKIINRLIIFIYFTFLISINISNAQTWTWVTQISGTTQTLRAVSFSDLDHGTAVGTNGTILRTTNAGQTWSPQLSGVSVHLNGVRFLNEDTGIIVGNNGTVLRTTNGGTNWSSISSGITTNILSVSFPSDLIGTAVGVSGRIIRTTDGGLTWAIQTSGTTAPLDAVSFVNDNLGLATGLTNILLTTNGGQTWTNQASGGRLYGVHFITSSVAYAAGTNGRILKTTNTGSSWVALTSGVSSQLNSIFFSDALNGQAVGSNTNLRTTDGGATWYDGGGSFNRVFQAAFLNNDNVGTIVGQSGVILRRTSFPIYEANLKNDVQVAPNQYEFDIFLKRIGTQPFELFGAQVGLLIDDAAFNGGNASCVYIIGSSEITNEQEPENPNFTSVINGKRVFELSAKLPNGGLAGNGFIMSPTGYGTKLGRFRIATTASQFAVVSANIVWNFEPADGYVTIIQAFNENHTIANDITDPQVHFNNLLNDPLPVELKSFAANAFNRNVMLSWTTKTEVNAGKFILERAFSSTTPIWIIAGEVSASGNSNSTKEYNFTDTRLNSGKYLYRIKIVDNDGTSHYSKEIEAEVSLPNKYAISQNYPNPFNPTTKIDYQLPFDSKVTIELYGITGEKIATILNGEIVAGYYSIDINASALNLASGVYIYRINAAAKNNQTFVQVKKLMLTK